MSDATKNMILRIVIHGLVLLLLYVFQFMVFSELRILGVAPLIIPLAVIGVALFEGPSWGGGYGVAAGVLCDVGYAETTVMYTILLTALGMGVGLLSSYLLAKGFPSYFLCSVGTLVIIAFFQMFSLLVYQRVEPGVLLRVGLYQTLYSLVFLLPMYYVVRALGRRARG